ncbi:unnamed protein product [Schistosoma margrebowiei]|uniref:Uncharacterized protein n=1 Tax=Schistosoma margrebowiei TaxID=48269 RepID=A0A3P8CBK8_9TREM|nr:unnamed protein product [Schistosoma margrebowiei]
MRRKAIAESDRSKLVKVYVSLLVVSIFTYCSFWTLSSTI